MLVSENMLKWAMRFYPPLLLQRIWIKRFHKDFFGAEVKVFKSVFNLNYNRSIFGGTIYSAADPFYAVLFYQIMLRKGYKVIVWQKAAEISYIKPSRSDIYFKISISVEEVEHICSLIDTYGKAEHRCILEFKDEQGEVTARVSSLVYIRNLDPHSRKKSYEQT